ncbi:MAG: hypothetical protein IPJ30_13025 [Acidobacteria bacterium]|nr:hypothetical protein [Acidobacteriota bacterium]
MIKVLYVQVLFLDDIEVIDHIRRFSHLAQTRDRLCNREILRDATNSVVISPHTGRVVRERHQFGDIGLFPRLP